MVEAKRLNPSIRQTCVFNVLAKPESFQNVLYGTVVNMPYDVRTKLEEHLPFIGLIAIAVFIGAGLFPGPKSEPDPLNHTAYGCFASQNSPSIRLNPSGMIIRQKNFPIIGFHLERHKTGIVLTAERPISANSSTGGYLYTIDNQGSGRYLPFFKVVNQKTYGVFDEAELHSFHMLATDGRYIAYIKSNLSECI